MKRLFGAFFVLLAISAAISCQKETDKPIPDENGIVPEGMNPIKLTATCEQTKTTLSEGHTLWAAGDRIAVVSSDGSVSAPFDIQSGQGTATAEFEGYIPDGTTALYAVYPAERCSSVSGSTVKISIPVSREGDFGSGNVAVAKVSEGGLAFKNVTAFISFTLPAGTDVTSVVIESVDGSNLAGILSVDCSGSTPAPSTIESGASSITTTTSSGAGTYYIAIAPGVTHSKGFKMSYKKGEDITGVFYLNRNITTSANNNYEMGEVETKGNYYVTVSGAGNGNGMSWANAMSAAQMWKKLHLSGADNDIDNVKFASINGATFHLAAGTYDWGSGGIGNTSTPTINIDKTDEVSITVKGGYNASTGARDIVNNVTAFSGNGGHRVLSLGGNMNVSFDGISFVNGKVTGLGAGILISGGSWSFTDCSFSDNEATHGGAIRFESTGNLTLTRTHFDANEATGDGGALSLKNGTISLTGCTLTNNLAGGLGGAIDIFDDAVMTVTNSSFSSNTANFGGAIIVESGTQTISGGSFENNTASTNAGAIRVLENAFLSIDGTLFQGNSASKYGGALDIESSNSSVTNQINNAVFKGNNAQWGGAVEIDGSGSTTKVVFSGCTFGGTGSGEPNYVTRIENKDADGGAIHAEGDSYVNVGTSTFTGNTAANRGGALAIKGDTMFQLFSDSFYGNHSRSGGVAYTEAASSKYPDLFIDECSFDNNYINASDSYGCTFNINGVSHFIMHNSSVKNSYATPTATGEHGAWIALDAVQNSTSFSNCSIIGGSYDSYQIYAYSGSWTNYFTSCIIVSETGSMKSIYSGGSTLDLSYTRYYNATSFMDSGNNRQNLLMGNFDGLEWSNAGSTSYYWKWNGTIAGAEPPKPSSSHVLSRVSMASSAFVTWSGGDFSKDQRGVARSGNCWPGAYQNMSVLREDLQVITWNIRSSEMGDTGDQAWSARRSGMYAFINDHQPQIISMQECEADQRTDILGNCSGYAAIYDQTSLSWWQQFQGVEKSGEVILYKTADISVQSSGVFWLTSGAPTTPTKSSDQNSYRSCAWMKCTYKGQKMLVMDVHLSYRTASNSTPGSADAIALRQTEMGVVKTWIDGHYNSSTDGWLLFMGDMNTSQNEAIFDQWKDGTYGYISRDACVGASTGKTYNDWGGSNSGTMDYQFFKGFPTVKSYTICTDTYSSVNYLSDHWPVVVLYGLQ